MCHVKKLVVYDLEGTELDLGVKFYGHFDCPYFNCRGCNEGFVDGQAPKRMRIKQRKNKIMINVL